ncbi:CocE/NonD family hydrolase [Sphingomonas sp.]|uniref:CocE/NonD family hydrolase n=1 Tax=Sphingomonas sp. TaxID=28214 RepID=UPI001B1C72B6|nr:CocE/NonD family hydrolase [Sphingomonas sp.]MBO9711703.1 CocE/NonD family hydrolase [Sphingomonas sp.]
MPAMARDTPEVARTSLYVPVRDGTRLAVNIYRPVVDGKPDIAKLPVVFAFTPYRARYFDKDHRIVELVDSPIFGLRNLVKAGYVVATADIRGKGASFGARRGFLDQTEARDGYDLIQWLAAQPWSNGKAGIVGCSYLGGTSMLVASARPPALVAAFAAATDIDKYSFVRNGGITAQFNTRPDEPLSVDLASVPVDADTDGSMLKAAVAEHAGNTPMAKLWETMPFRDSVSPLTGNRFWEEVGPYTRLDRMRAPGLAWLFWSNWEDEPTEQMILNAVNIPSTMIIGPGSHCEGPKAFDIADIERRFLDFHLKGIDNGFGRQPRFWWYDEKADGSGAMRASETAPGTGIARTPLYLSAAANDAPAPVDNGSVAEARPRVTTARFTVDYDLGTGDYFAFWPAPLDGKGLTYTSRPLAADATIQGYPIARVTAAIDRADANLFVYLEDVDPAGKARMISFGRLAASHRKVSRPPYDRLDLPYHSGLAADVAPMVPGEPALLEVSMGPRAYTFAAGHRLRVTLTGADPRQRNLAAIRQEPPPVFTITSGGAAASHVDIPFIEKPAFR